LNRVARAIHVADAGGTVEIDGDSSHRDEIELMFERPAHKGLFQVPFVRLIRNEASVKPMAVGAISEASQVNSIQANSIQINSIFVLGRADPGAMAHIAEAARSLHAAAPLRRLPSQTHGFAGGI
jgi:uncharacterized protein with ACT and thioredoxin-like domain